MNFATFFYTMGLIIYLNDSRIPSRHKKSFFILESALMEHFHEGIVMILNTNLLSQVNLPLPLQI